MFWPSTAVKFLVEPVTGEVGDGGRAGERDRRAADVGDVDRGGVDARLGVGVAAVDVEDAGRGGGDDGADAMSASRRPSRWWP